MPGKLSYLDRVKNNYGTADLKNFFRGLARSHPAAALRLLSDVRLNFSCLYALWPLIESLGLLEKMNSRNFIALNICSWIRDKKWPGGIDYFSSEYKQSIYPVLKWIFLTGLDDDGIYNLYDQIIDTAAAVLIKNYSDRSILPDVTRLIFSRCSKGLYYHDLVWALFRSRDQWVLRLTANYLRSDDPKEAALACQLLNFHNDKSSGPDCYSSYINWLDENQDYIYFTGESFQSGCAPEVCCIDYNSKYLCKNVFLSAIQPPEPLRDSEVQCLSNFNSLDSEDMDLLAGHSCRIHSRNPLEWDEWIRLPIEEQLKSAREGRFL